MRDYLKYYFVSCIVVLSAGCMGVPMTDDVNQVIGKPFTNPPRAEKRWVKVKDQYGREITVIHSSYYSIKGNRYKSGGNFEEPIYYKKQVEGVNTRFFINWGAPGFCSYSLLVGPDDIILSWRNEGANHASDCHRP
jgi:hypothetical protein